VDFDWDDANIGHIAAHGLAPEQVEDALLDSGRIGATAYSVGDERRWAAVGATQAGRVLFVVFTLRSGAVRVITAREAGRAERRRYRRGGK